MHADAPPISVVVCTKDRPEALVGCLEALRRLEYSAFEVIVVDNASRDPAVAAVLARSGVRHVRETRQGLDWARNRGLAEARYDLVAYVDDDAVVSAGWLRALAAAFRDPTVMGVTGLVLPAELATPAQELFERYGGMGKGSVARRFEPAKMQPRELLAVHHLGVGANMAFRRAALEAVGGFDPALDVGTPAAGAGDLDLFHRLLIGGAILYYEPRAVVRHRHRREMSELERQLYSNGRAFGVYLIRRWLAGQVQRRETVRFGVGWIGGWLLARLYRSLAGRLDVPARFAWAELRGAMHAPWAYWQTYRHARRGPAGRAEDRVVAD